MAVTLRQLEDQPPAAFGFLLHQVKRSRVTAGDLPALGENQLQQGVSVTFRRKSNAYAIESFEIGVRASEFALRAQAVLRRAQALESPLQRSFQHQARHTLR